MENLSQAMKLAKTAGLATSSNHDDQELWSRAEICLDQFQEVKDLGKHVKSWKSKISPFRESFPQSCTLIVMLSMKLLIV